MSKLVAANSGCNWRVSHFGGEGGWGQGGLVLITQG